MGPESLRNDARCHRQTVSLFNYMIVFTGLGGGLTVAFLRFRSTELMPLEDLWRGLKRTVAANRCYASLDELAARPLGSTA